MIRTGFVILLALLVLVITLPAYGKDASFRCGNTFIDTDDSRARVLHHCGEPSRREIIGYVRSTENEELIEFVVEAWTYDSAPDIFNIITFKGNRVLNIESEKK
jgi:hypothetical protein